MCQLLIGFQFFQVNVVDPCEELTHKQDVNLGVGSGVPLLSSQHYSCTYFLNQIISIIINSNIIKASQVNYLSVYIGQDVNLSVGSGVPLLPSQHYPCIYFLDQIISITLNSGIIRASQVNYLSVYIGCLYTIEIHRHHIQILFS